MAIDPTINSLLPIHQIGQDGGGFWIGQVEEIDEPKQSNRFRVRIVSLHSSDCEEVPTEELPWAHSALPVNVPYKTGGVSGATANLEEGDWVFGAWLDNDNNIPLILASIGTVAGSKDTPPENVQGDSGPPPDGGKGKCLSFKHQVNSRTNPPTDQPANPARNPNLGSAQVAGGSPQTFTKADGAHAAENSVTNPFGTKVCVGVANAECNGNTKKELKYVLGELFKMVQDSGGNLGDYLTSSVNGEIMSYANKAQGYINKVLRIIKSALARVKGEIIAALRKGVEQLVKLILTPFQGILDGVQAFLENALEKIGCSIEDIYERLVDFITSLIFDYLLKVFRAATCQVDIFINAIINKIVSLVSNLLNSVLGPLQRILSIASSALNVVGGAMFKIMSILGISCGGLDSKCGDDDKRCTKPEKKEGSDFLDDLLKAIEDGPLDFGQSVCNDARGYDAPELTGGFFFGGLPAIDIGSGNSPIYGGSPDGGAGTLPPGGDEDTSSKVITYEIEDTNVIEGEEALIRVRRSGFTTVSSSVTFITQDGSAKAGIDFIANDGILGFGPNQTERFIKVQTFKDTVNDTPQDFTVKIDYATGIPAANFISNIAVVTIGLAPERDPVPGSPFVPPAISTPVTVPAPNPPQNVLDLIITDPEDDPIVPTIPTELNFTQYSIEVEADKINYQEGEFITFTITSEGIPNNTVMGYSLFGTNISSSDIIGGNLYGTFMIQDNASVVVVGIAEDAEIEGPENMRFNVNGTGAFADVIILGQEESTPIALVSQTTTQFKEPTIGQPIVDDDGKIIEIPIDDPGDPYLLPPNLAITGQGFGAMGVPLLDKNGFVTEIRITQRGRNFVPNRPDNVNCVLDSLTLTRPGSGYTSIPTVFINGESDKVVARINAAGFVVGFDVIDRTQIYDSAPTVTIVGGGGFGANALASLSCLDSETRDLLGYAKIGTGRYVDCPS